MRSRRFWLVNGSLAAVVTVLAVMGLTTLFHKAGAKTPPRTVTASIGTVQSTVTASGNISSAQTENLGFATGGTVTAIDTKVGQQVGAGQTLATVDTSSARAALTAAQDQLTAAEDNLSLAESGGETPPQISQDNATVANDEAQVASAQTTLNTAQERLASDQATCATDSSVSSAATGSGTGGSGPTGTGGSGSGGPATGSGTPSSGSGTTATTPSSSAASSACNAVTSDTQAVDQAQSALTQAQNNLNQENLSIAARRYVNPATVLQDQAAVTQSQQTVAQDSKTLSETTLTAPFSGTITAINGSVGQTVSGGGSSPGSSSSSGSGSGGSGTGGAGTGAGATGSSSSPSSSSSSSSSDFMSLSNLSSLEVVAGFPEADAVKVKVGQPATVTLSALPTAAPISGTVTAISPTPTVVSNVVTYDDTISLTNPPADVQTGMSVSVAVVVDSATNAVMVPSSAVTSAGRQSVVTVLKNGRQTTQTVTVGLVGDTDTQILSGLSAGTVVVEPSITAGSAGSTGRTGATGFAGLGGLGGFAGLGGGGGLGGGARPVTRGG